MFHTAAATASLITPSSACIPFPPHPRLPQMMVNVGLALASLLSLILQATLDKQAMLEWGWRVPFLAAGVTAVIG
jgi:MFS family permease